MQENGVKLKLRIIGKKIKSERKDFPTKNTKIKYTDL
jgi:hypothetical protein